MEFLKKYYGWAILVILAIAFVILFVRWRKCKGKKKDASGMPLIQPECNFWTGKPKKNCPGCRGKISNF